MGKDLQQTKLQQILQNSDVSISENNTCPGQGKVLNLQDRCCSQILTRHYFARFVVTQFAANICPKKNIIY